MKLEFRYNINKEYSSFSKSFNSINHKNPSKVQILFFQKYSKLTPKNALMFSKDIFKTIKYYLDKSKNKPALPGELNG